MHGSHGGDACTCVPGRLHQGQDPTQPQTPAIVHGHPPSNDSPVQSNAKLQLVIQHWLGHLHAYGELGKP